VPHERHSRKRWSAGGLHCRVGGLQRALCRTRSLPSRTGLPPLPLPSAWSSRPIRRPAASGPVPRLNCTPLRCCLQVATPGPTAHHKLTGRPRQSRATIPSLWLPTSPRAPPRRPTPGRQVGCRQAPHASGAAPF
jgi:hypothetical protein